METILFNNVKETSFQKFEVLLRCAYVLSQGLGVFGQIFWFITDWEIFGRLHPQLRKTLILKHADVELSESYIDANQTLNALRKVKYLSPEHLKIKHRIENVIKRLESLFVREMKEKFQVERFDFFNKLIQEDSNLKICFLSMEDEKYDLAMGKTSWLLNLGEKSTHLGPDIFWIGSEFFDPELGFNLVWTDQLEQLFAHSDRNSVKIISLFKIAPNLLLNETELKYLRKELTPNLQEWHKAFDPIIEFWMEVTKEKPPTENFQIVMETGKKIEQALSSSSLILGQSKDFSEGLAKHEMELCLGYFPTELFWDFYKKMGFLSAQTELILQKMAQEKNFRKFTPVFVLKNIFSEDEVDDTFIDEAPKASLKWIDI